MAHPLWRLVPSIFPHIACDVIFMRVKEGRVMMVMMMVVMKGVTGGWPGWEMCALPVQNEDPSQRGVGNKNKSGKTILEGR